LFTLRTTLRTTPTWAASSSLVKIILSARTSEIGLMARSGIRLAGGAGEDQMHFIRLGGGEQALELVELHRVVGASAGGVDQDEIAIAHGPIASRRSSGRTHDAKRRADDVGVFELIDGGDAVGVERDQSDAVLLAKLEDWRRAWRAWWFCRRRSGRSGRRRAGRWSWCGRSGRRRWEQAFELLGDFSLTKSGCGRAARGGAARAGLTIRGQVVGDLVVDQLHVMFEEFLGNVGGLLGATSRRQIFDHRFERVDLLGDAEHGGVAGGGRLQNWRAVPCRFRRRDGGKVGAGGGAAAPSAPPMRWRRDSPRRRGVAERAPRPAAAAGTARRDGGDADVESLAGGDLHHFTAAQPQPAPGLVGAGVEDDGIVSPSRFSPARALRPWSSFEGLQIHRRDDASRPYRHPGGGFM
jgi:hypothetical protein